MTLEVGAIVEGKVTGITKFGAFVDLGEGDVNWKDVIHALRHAGFKGYLTGEVFKPESEPDYLQYYQSVSQAMDALLVYE